MRILILVNSVQELDENHALISSEFFQRGHQVFFGLINTISSHHFRVSCDAVEVRRPYAFQATVEGPIVKVEMSMFQLVWQMNQPHPRIARDVWQLLWMFSQDTPFVNSVVGMVFLNNKNTLASVVPPEHLPTTTISNSFCELWSIYDKARNDTWIAKPTNEGCGIDVYLLKPEDTNIRTILQSITGNTGAQEEIAQSNFLGLQNQYGILQAYIPEVKQGEKRIIVAGGKIVAHHGRQIAANDHRSNITQGGLLEQADLTPQEQMLCQHVAQRLSSFGIYFAGIDLAYPFILEVNIVNPGGLYDALQVTGVNNTPIAVEAILEKLNINQVIQ
jgi:glutathione synthase